MAYIGRSEKCYKRLRKHNIDKEFWDRAVVLTSTKGTFGNAHTRYLEYKCIQEAKEAGRYSLEENTDTPSEPDIPSATRANVRDSLNTIRTLLSVLGYPILEPARSESGEVYIIYLTAGEADAKGEWGVDTDGLVVYEGSVADPELDEYVTDATRRRRKELLDAGIVEEKDGGLVFTEDYVFGTPTAAADFVLGSHVNGWDYWKDEDGNTLDELVRE